MNRTVSWPSLWVLVWGAAIVLHAAIASAQSSPPTCTNGDCYGPPVCTNGDCGPPSCTNGDCGDLTGCCCVGPNTPGTNRVCCCPSSNLDGITCRLSLVLDTSSPEFHYTLAQETISGTRPEGCDLLMAQGLPCGPIQTSEEVAHCPHIAKRDLLVKIPDPIVGQLTMVGNPIKMEEHKTEYRPLPNLGADTDTVLSSIGYSAEKIKKLRESKTI